MPATVDASPASSITRQVQLVFIALMPGILQEAKAMAKTYHVRHVRSFILKRSTLKRACVTVASVAGSALVVFAHAAVAWRDAPNVYAIKDAQIVTGAGKTIGKGTIVFRNGLITDVGESVK